MKRITSMKSDFITTRINNFRHLSGDIGIARVLYSRKDVAILYLHLRVLSRIILLDNTMYRL